MTREQGTGNSEEVLDNFTYRYIPLNFSVHLLMSHAEAQRRKEQDYELRHFLCKFSNALILARIKGKFDLVQYRSYGCVDSINSNLGLFPWGNIVRTGCKIGVDTKNGTYWSSTGVYCS